MDFKKWVRMATERLTTLYPFHIRTRAREEVYASSTHLFAAQ